MKKLILICLILILNQAYAQDTLSVSKQYKTVQNLNRDIFIDKSLDKNTIELLPYANLNKLRLMNSSAVYYGNNIQLQGISSGENNSIVDGMQVNDVSFFPKSAISIYNYWSTTNPIEYGNSLCGMVEINTLVPTGKSTFDINMLSSATAGKQMEINQKQVTFMYGSPFSFLKSLYHDQKLLPSILVAGNLNFMKDHNPSYIGSTSVNDETHSSLYNAPLIPSGHGAGTYLSAEFVTKDDFQTYALRKNSGLNSFNPYIKIILPFTKSISIAMGSYMNIIWGKEGLYRNAMFNAEMNPDISENNYNNYIRLDHDIINSQDLKINYRLQMNYIYRNYKQQSAIHKDNFFDYGYVGKFKTTTIKSYELGQDEVTGMYAYLQNGFADTLVTFEQTDINPGLSNYTQSYYNYYNTAPGHYRNLDEILLGGGLINGFLSRNRVYGMWNNVSMPDDNYIKGQYSRLNPRLTINFVIKENHHIALGFEYDKTSVSYYTIHPVDLWAVLRQQVNMHIKQFDLSNPHPVYDNNNVFQDTILYDRLYLESEQAMVDYNLRKKLGLATNGTEWIDVYSYDPSVFSLDMFSADELLNSGNSLVDYCGYDYAGNKSNAKNSLDFFTEKGTNGQYSRNIAPFTPVYLNAYAQYAYTSKRFNITAGLRIDRYDANQPVLKDPYLLFAAKTASEVTNLGPHPDNIGEDFVVYVDDVANPTSIKGYRDGNTWYNSLGTEITDPSVIETSSGIAPYLVYPKQHQIDATAFTDYKPAINYLPSIEIDYLLFKNTQLFYSFQMLTQNPVNNNFRPQQYWFIWGSDGAIFNNPDLKPERLTITQIGARQMVFKSLQFELSYCYKNFKGLNELSPISGAYPVSYFTVINCPDNFINHAIDVSIMYRKTGRHEINTGIYYERLLNENKKFYNVSLSKNVTNGFVEYSLNKKSSMNEFSIPRPIFSVSFVSHYRSETYSNTAGTPFSYVYGKYKLPAFYYFDIKFEKPFYLGKRKNMCATVFVSIQNILNKKNVFSVYPSTGKTDDDGYLSNPLYQAQIAAQTNEQAYRDQYSVYKNDPGNYDIPRMLLFGFSFGL